MAAMRWLNTLKFAKDFSWGFYCNVMLNQAKRWASRNNERSVLNVYDYVENDELRVLRFDGMTEEWFDFIVHCRSGGVHNYDVVEGPMADDTIWNYVNDFIRGSISRKQFWALVEFAIPTHQISFHTLRALDCLTFLGSEVLNDK